MNDAHYMQRALQLAKHGLGSVSPNPMVGCVIVYNNKIIGEGWHQQFGHAHAEVNAINSVNDKNLLKESTVYVTLEPCSYQGKTPACSSLLINEGVKKVIIATLDPNPKVAGIGVKALQAAKINVEVGVLEKDSVTINKRFFINQKLHRPYVILKWAQTKDGFIARTNFDSKWISNEHSRQLVHKWRAEEDAILVGKNTAKYDNPSLTVREWAGANPVRVILDRQLELDRGLQLFNGEVNTLVYNLKENSKHNNFELIKLESDNFIEQLLLDLYQRDIGSIIIEGGSTVIQNFIEQGTWDEARMFSSQQEFGEGIEAPLIEEPLEEDVQIKGDRLTYYLNPKSKILWQKN